MKTYIVSRRLVITQTVVVVAKNKKEAKAHVDNTDDVGWVSGADTVDRVCKAHSAVVDK